MSQVKGRSLENGWVNLLQGMEGVLFSSRMPRHRRQGSTQNYGRSAPWNRDSWPGDIESEEIGESDEREQLKELGSKGVNVWNLCLNRPFVFRCFVCLFKLNCIWAAVLLYHVSAVRFLVLIDQLMTMNEGCLIKKRREREWGIRQSLPINTTKNESFLVSKPATVVVNVYAFMMIIWGQEQEKCDWHENEWEEREVFKNNNTRQQGDRNQRDVAVTLKKCTRETRMMMMMLTPSIIHMNSRR